MSSRVDNQRILDNAHALVGLLSAARELADRLMEHAHSDIPQVGEVILRAERVRDAIDGPGVGEWRDAYTELARARIRGLIP